MLNLRLLGGFEFARVQGETSDRLGPKLQGLLAYLAMSGGASVPRGRLAGLLWGESDEDNARHSLSQALTTIRRALGPSGKTVLRATADGVQLEKGSIQLDVERFELLADSQEVTQLLEARALYRGEFLQGLDLCEPDFEEWMLGERYRLAETAAVAFSRLLDIQISAESYQEAAKTARDLIAVTPLDESAHARLIDLYGLLNRRGLAEAHYERCRDLYQRELDIGPGKEIEDAIERARAYVQTKTVQISPTRQESAPEPLVGERRLTTILAADVVGYSRMMSADEAGTLNSIRDVRSRFIDPKATVFHGRVVKLMGDGALMEFGSVVDAVNFAIDVQKSMVDYNRGVPNERQIKFRIGINVGDIIVDGDDIYGDGVNIAARLEGLSDEGGICISGTVYDHVQGKIGVRFQNLAEQHVKNIPKPVQAYKIVLDSSLPRSGLRFWTDRASRRPSWAVVASVLSILIAMVGISQWSGLWAPEDKQSSNEDVQVATPDRPSIAVLPFNNLSGDPDQDYFSDGMTDDLITDLSRISGLFVIARNSVFTYKDRPVNTQRVGRELGVSYVLVGSVRKAGNRVRINAQLVDTATDLQLWADRYDRDLTDVFAVQDDVAEKIIAALAVQLTSAEKVQLARPPTANVRAYDLYLRAKEHYYSGDMARLRQSMQLYQNAIAMDPGFAQAHADYARAAADAWRFNNAQIMPTPMAFETADDRATTAIELDPGSSVAHSVLAMLKMGSGEYDSALELARRAVYLDPNSAEAYLDLAVVLGYSGLHAECLEVISTALRLNPKPPTYLQSYHGWALVMNHRYEDAIAVLEPLRGTERGIFAARRGDSPDEILAMAYALAGQTTEAREVVEDYLKLIPFANLAYFRSLYDHHKRHEDLEFRLHALRLAGFPEWPFDYQIDPEQQVLGSELKDLTIGRTWAGWDVSRNASFVQEINAEGTIVYAGEATLMSGTAELQDSELCRSFELELIGRRQCGHVYRIQDAEGRERYDFAYVTAPTILKFSIKK